MKKLVNRLWRSSREKNHQRPQKAVENVARCVPRPERKSGGIHPASLIQMILITIIIGAVAVARQSEAPSFLPNSFAQEESPILKASFWDWFKGFFRNNPPVLVQVKCSGGRLNERGEWRTEDYYCRGTNTDPPECGECLKEQNGDWLCSDRGYYGECCKPKSCMVDMEPQNPDPTSPDHPMKPMN